MATSRATPADNAPLALAGLEVPGHTGPTPDGELGINRAAAQDNFPQNGLQVFIPAWSAMGAGDSVQVLLGGDVVVSDTVDASEVDQRITLFIAPERFTNGSTTLAYKVTRFGQPPEASADLPVYVKLTLPGGNDQNGDIPGHSELHLEIDAEYIENGVDKDQAEAGVPVTVKAYPFMAEHDEIRLSWGGQFLRHTVLEAEVGTDIVMTVEEATILAAGDSGSEGLAVTFEVYDLVDNRSEDWSAEIRLVVDTGNTRLDAPIIKEAVSSVLDLDTLGDGPVTAQIIAMGSNFALKDEIEVNLRGTTADGKPVNFTCDPKPVSSVPSIVEVSVPISNVRLLAQTQAIFSYRLIKQSGPPDLLSKGRFVSVIGEAKRLLAPIARDALQGTLDPALPRTTVEVPWDDSMDEGQVIDLKWLGVRPDLSIYFPELVPHIISHNEAVNQLPVRIVVPGTHLAAIEGGTLELYYELLSDETVRAVVRRESAHAATLRVGEPRAELPAPDVEGEEAGVLDPEMVPDGTRLIVRKYNGIAAGDEVHCEWLGSITGKYEDYVRLNSITATRDVPFDIGSEVIAGNVGGTVQASYFVIRASGGTSVSDVRSLEIGEQSVPLPTLVLTVDGVVDGQLDLDDVAAGVKAQVAPYDRMDAGDTVYLYWADDNGAHYEYEKSITGNAKDKPVLFTVPFEIAAGSLDSNVSMTSRAVLFEGDELNSNVKAFMVIQGAEEIPLPSPTIIQASDGVLDPSDVPQGATVLISSEAQLKTGDSVTLNWQGQPGNGSVRPTVEVTRDGELQIPIAYATVIANDGYSVVLSYTVRRSSGEDQGSSPEATYEVRTELAPGLLKVMGARYNRSNSYRASACSRLLSAFNSTTMQPIDAQWQYQGDITWTTAKTWRDTDSWKLLHVKISNDSMTLNPANIIGNGNDGWFDVEAAFVAHRDAGDVVGWGVAGYGASIPLDIIAMDDIVEVSCTRSAYAARRQNGSVVVWGDVTAGGSMEGLSPLGFTSVIGNRAAFAGIKTNSQVVAWGPAISGGTVPGDIRTLTDIKQVVGSKEAFAAIRRTGQVVAWGREGGTVPDAIRGLTDIVEVMGNDYAFAARRNNGRLVAWGLRDYAGTVPASIASLTDIVELSAASERAFAARRATGQVVAWGSETFGGKVPDSVASLTDIVAVASGLQSFTVLRGNGHVVGWGVVWVPGDIAALSDIVQIAGSSTAFAALRKGGTVVAWGSATFGGDTSSVVSLLTNVLALYSNTKGFVALTSDGRVVTWGEPAGGGNSDAVQHLLAGQVSYKASAAVASRARALAARHSRTARVTSKGI